MKSIITESNIEDFALDILKEIGYEIVFGPTIAPAPEGNGERKSYADVVLVERLRKSIGKFNKHIPEEAREEAVKKVLRTDAPTLEENNRLFHKMLTDGVDVEYRKDGRIVGDKVWLFDFKNYEHNELLAINQFTIIENGIDRRPDIILFVNGLPLVVIELKNLADENATIWSAYSQLQTYKHQLSPLFRFNEILVVSDGIDAKAGTITSSKERFMQWKTIDGTKAPKGKVEMEILFRGMFDNSRILDIVRNFIVFEKDTEIQKKLAGYHQYWATNKAIESTIRASGQMMRVREAPESYGLASVREQPKGDKKAGVVWHTQGSGKSLTMMFYAGKLVRELDNPTIVLLTDRNDLDDQLFTTFAKAEDLLRQKPVQAESRAKIKELLAVSSGGIVFTTIQKFFPEQNKEEYPTLSKRDNIVVIADEAHRSQYGFSAKILDKKDKTLITYGYAKYMRDALPNASFIGFTGTPIEKSGKSTPAVFGKYVDVYDIEQSVNDGATVRIFYESRLAKLELKPEERPKIDKEFDEITEVEELAGKNKIASKWARLEKVVGAQKRIKKIAKDIVNHFEERLSIIEGKGMIIGMSRRICVEIYNEIIKLKPEWHNEDDKKGFVKVIMTGSASDPKEWQSHIRNKMRRGKIGDEFKNPKGSIKLAIVRDMWLTGFDVPSLHTMYIDKPMQGHTLMQAIARVNRVYKDKQGGLIVDYMGIGVDLRKALMSYTESGGKGKPTFDQEDAVIKMKEKYDVVKSMFHGFDYKSFFKLQPKERISFIPNMMEHILKEKGKSERFVKEVTALFKAFQLSIPHEQALKIKEEVGLFQAIKSTLTKSSDTDHPMKEDLDTAVNQILSKAVISDRIIDIFAAAGLKKPDMSVLSEGFLHEVKEMPQKNLAFETLKRLLNNEIRIYSRKNIIQGKSFMEMLDKTIKKYTNRSVEAAQVIEEMIELARKFRAEMDKGKDLGLNEDEKAFYDALYVNDSAVKILGDEILRKIALELTEIIRKSVTVDWTLRESIQAKLRINVKKILEKYGYPPDKQKKATETVLEQAKVVAKDWADK